MASDSRLRGNDEGGFTILEILVVLVIGEMAYAVILGVPFRGPSTQDLKAASRTLASGLRQAQSMALATRRDATLTLDLDARETRREDLVRRREHEREQHEGHHDLDQRESARAPHLSP